MTRYPYLTLVFLFIVSGVSGQTDKIEQILNTSLRITERVDATESPDKIFLKTEPGSFSIVNPSEIQKAKGRVILKVELVFTTGSGTQNDNQKTLNRKRLESLHRLDSAILKNELVQWELVGQTSSMPIGGNKIFHGFILTLRNRCSYEYEIAYLETVLTGENPMNKTSVEPANNPWRPYPRLILTPKADSVISVREDFDPNTGKIYLTKELLAPYYDTIVPAGGGFRISPAFIGGAKALSEYLSKSLQYPDEAREKGIEGTVYVLFVVSKTGKVSSVRPLKGVGGGCIEEAVRLIESMPEWKPGITHHSDRPVHGEYILPIRFSLEGLSPLVDSVYLAGGLSRYAITPDPFLFYTFPHPKAYYFSDSTIIKILDRHPEWNRMHIVSDITECMASYAAQLLAFHLEDVRQDSQRIESFTFFNDYGGGLFKKIGDGKGVSHIDARDFIAVKEMVEQMMKGNSADKDIPDNDVEALFRGMANCKNCNDILLIADNYSVPGDTALAPGWVEHGTIRVNGSSLNITDRHVHILLCGTEGGINTVYLDLARRMKGTIHTGEEDIVHLAEMKEGETIQIGGRLYKLQDGKFVVGH